MRRYFTWRCIALHLLVVVLVPTFLYAGWWQYHVALGGNDLSWVYTVEWPFFAVYAVYVWWKMIHDKTTMLDRLWAVKARAAANAEGKPLHEIPGWAMDKGLSREVVQASLEAARAHALGKAAPSALGSGTEERVHAGHGRRELALPRTTASSSPAAAREQHDEHDGREDAVLEPANGAPVIDAQVVRDTVVADEELDAYNRYLAELAVNGPPKRWRAPRGRPRARAEAGEPGAAGSLVSTPPELEHGDARTEG